MIRWFRRDPQPGMRQKKYLCHFCQGLFKRFELRLTHTLEGGPWTITHRAVWACTTNCKDKGVSL